MGKRRQKPNNLRMVKKGLGGLNPAIQVLNEIKKKSTGGRKVVWLVECTEMPPSPRFLRASDRSGPDSPVEVNEL